MGKTWTTGLGVGPVCTPRLTGLLCTLYPLFLQVKNKQLCDLQMACAGESFENGFLARHGGVNLLSRSWDG